MKFFKQLSNFKIKVFTLFDIPLYLGYSFILFFVIALIYNLVLLGISHNFDRFIFPLMFMSTLWFFVILHEYGHALAAKYIFKLKVDLIILHMFGGLACINLNARKHMSDLIITLAGPLVNLGVFLILWPIILNLENTGILYVVLFYVLTANFIIFTFNMLPLFPMDGGRILRSLISIFTKDFYLATLITVSIGQILAILIVVWSFYYFF